MNRLILFVLILSLLSSCNHADRNTSAETATESADNTPPLISYMVMKELPHDTSAYTEGFLFHDGQLYESTGTVDNMPDDRLSRFGTVDSATGKLQTKVEIDREKYFGEGIVFLKGKVYQLTWTTKIGFTYDAKNFKKLGEFTFPSKEGWGMTTNGAQLIMSDGTSNISYLDPDSSTPVEVKIHYSDGDSAVKTLNSLRLVKILSVTDNNGPVSNINELELIKGYLYANQWQTNYILKIDTSSGKVVGKLDLDSIVREEASKFPGAEVLNGIAYDSASGKVYITGKLWPNIFEIKFPL
jgi:glutaminyl-peptide cyclotransferase